MGWVIAAFLAGYTLSKYQHEYNEKKKKED